ncbi:hypothetical protein [Halorhabdus sp. BNX81]|uniref:hypothetical protein n=1 Tax=Halorhabdus sp. BNX81 TaxID=2980181 RepID=UPI0023DD5DE8|nr:hypothetical protein [Halorhabdus sp. BNX81]WEL22221.1 Uncharacterized protein HBNXHr_2173 [Halorhabdus sp. BNX81]
MPDDPSFAIAARPSREYDRAGRLSYEGGTTFRIEPVGGSMPELQAVVDRVLDTGPYRHGDFLELPMVVYLVRDEETGDVFRVSIRNGAVRLHVLPETEAEGLRRFYEQLSEHSDCEWNVEDRVENGSNSS